MIEGVAPEPCNDRFLAIPGHGHLCTAHTQVKVEVDDLAGGQDGLGETSLGIVLVAVGPAHRLDLGAHASCRPVVVEGDVVAVGSHQLLQHLHHGQRDLDALLLWVLDGLDEADAIANDLEAVAGRIRDCEQLARVGVVAVRELVDCLARDQVVGLQVLPEAVEHVHLMRVRRKDLVLFALIELRQEGPDGAHAVPCLVAHVQDAVRSDSNGRDRREDGRRRRHVVIGVAVAGGVATVAAGVRAGEGADAAVAGNDADAVDPLRIALRDVQLTCESVLSQ